MLRMPQIIGIALGVLAAGLAMEMAPKRQQVAASDIPRILSECDGNLRRIVIHYTRDAQFIGKAYQEFLSHLNSGVEVVVVVPDTPAWEEFRGIFKSEAKLTPVICNHAITCWSRDRWICLKPSTPGPAHLICPLQEQG